MASSGQGLRAGIQILLAIVIVGLAYWLYLSITEPYKLIEQQEMLTEQTRDRMSDVRTALIRYEDQRGRYPMTLDSLLMFARQDSLLSMKTDSVFGAAIVLDSLIYSPRTGKQFDYSVNDTAQVKTYLLQDPDSEDHIGTLEADVTRLNAASWE